MPDSRPGDDSRGPSPIPYDTRADSGWTARVDEWPWIDRDGGSAAKTGPCPRCDHHMSVLDGPAGRRTSATGEGGDRMRASCNCPADHPGAPDGVRGCGANGLIEGS